MSNFSVFQASHSDIKDPELKKLVNDITDTLKVSAYQAIYNHTQKRPFTYPKLKVGVKKEMAYASVGEVLSKWVATKKPAQIKALSENNGIRTFRAASPFSANLLAHLDIKSAKYVFTQIDFTRDFSYINDRLMLGKIGSIFGIDDTPSSTPPTATPNYALKLNLKRVKCLDETDPEWFGSDKISAGGVSVDDKQVEAKITAFTVGNFNDGTKKDYNPVKVLKSFPLDSVNPSTFMALLTLAEKDAGGFGDFLKELFEAVKAEVTLIITAVSAAAGAAIGAAIGGSVGTAVAGPLGTIIGVVAGLILGALVAWLADALQDDVFEPQITGVTLHANAPFSGPVQRLTYRDFGGSYFMEVFWAAS